MGAQSSFLEHGGAAGASPVPPGEEANLAGPLHTHARPPLRPSQEELGALSLAAHARVRARDDAKMSQLQVMEALRSVSQAQDAAEKAVLSARKAQEIRSSVQEVRNESDRAYLGLGIPKIGKPFDATKV
ncbi:unnamed protein product [Symbiodinium natans]|uniref:Uncharacterized protein n=1 Tax=Symbiodinium natans TaxID=878477 RepID=A0A812LZN6_9DINO|nr:unnamed protein product [Symbiodinium natans]